MNRPPQANIRRRRFSPVWIVPALCAVLVSTFLVAEVRSRGPEVAIHFPDAEGLVPKKTLIKYLGVTVGKVTDVSVEEDSGTVKVVGRLTRRAARLAREGAVFYVVKPQVSFQGVEGLTTIFSGSSIEIQPGDGAPATDFRGFPDKGAVAREKPGLMLILTTPHNGSIQANDGVFYRGMRVGYVTETKMSKTGQDVLLIVKIEREYDQYVRDNTKFWEAGGVDAKMGLFGVKLKITSAQALWNGGIAFATPDAPGKPVKSGTSFGLEPQFDPVWDKWSPKL